MRDCTKRNFMSNQELQAFIIVRPDRSQGTEMLITSKGAS